MKKFFVCCCLIFFFCYTTNSQTLIIKGKIKCMNQNQGSTKGAENIIVIPTFMPPKATVTASRPSGYFELNTGLPIAKLQDKIITLYAVSRCTHCKEVAKRIFISEDQDRQNREDTKSYVTIKDWMLKTNCQQAELMPVAADSVLRLVIKQPEQNLDNVSAATVLVGAPSFLNFLTTLTTVVGTISNSGSFRADSLYSGKIKYGEFLFSSLLSHSANTGFNFSPSRDMSEAVFWNPSAIAYSRKANNISLLTNLKNNFKVGGFYRINKKFLLSAGGIYVWQDERRKVSYARGGNIVTADSMIMRLKEYVIFMSPVYSVNNKFSVALNLKSVWQNFNIPNSLFINPGDGSNTFTDSASKKQHFDVDISATFKASTALQIGVNLMNLAGTELYADAFVSGQPNTPIKKQRAIGLGLVYKWQRFNFGADVLITEDKFYDAALGVNYVPFNNALLSAGIAFKQLSYSFAFRIKHFRIAYINDNDWLINEQRKGKASILNGKIYGGFIFDFN
jgi:hypothetical protein